MADKPTGKSGAVKKEHYLYLGGTRAAAPLVKLKMMAGKTVELAHDRPDYATWCIKLLSTFGTTSHDFTTFSLGQLLDATGRAVSDTVEATRANAVLAAMAGLAPRDEAEGLLYQRPRKLTHGGFPRR